MSIWTRIAEALAALRNGEGLSAVFDKLRTQPDRSVGFAIAVIALGAKIAKADGEVTRNEVRAFREVFSIPPEEEDHAARVYNLARQDVAGFESYARQIRRMYDGDSATLSDLLEGLFHIAMADGDYHPGENAFLTEVAEILDVDPRTFARLRARFVPDAEQDPYDVLGVDHHATLDDVRTAWRRLVRDGHPDRVIARGLPEEAVAMAEKRLVAINLAMERIARDHAGSGAVQGSGSA
jgi:DnaJ like chaperone protein